MKVAFRKITATPKHFALQQDGLAFNCELERKNAKIIKLSGKISGEIELICDRSGEPFIKAIDQDLVLHISDGICDVSSQGKNTNTNLHAHAVDLDFDIIESFNDYIDLDDIFNGEIELIKSDYHIKD
ncbi:MAG: hypothetical protein E7K04_04560 [Helicobacter sp.]|nr:hypothetical protein [Helicobacter sp.]